MSDAAPDPRDLDAACRALEARWHDEIPISAAMGVRVAAYDGTRLRVRAALAPNVNVHGTAFAGSLFSAAALCGWGLLYLKLRESGADASIVFVDGRIRCLAPARADIEVDSSWSDDAQAALAGLAQSGRGRVHLHVKVAAGGDAVAEFSGQYAARASPEPP